jgi:transposase-like protein
LTLRVHQIREDGFSTELIARSQRSEQAFILTLMEMVVNGVSTRKVARITQELCGTSFAKSAVSELSLALDPLVAVWNECDLRQQRYPFLLVDAVVLKVREGSRVRSCSVFVATGVNEAGFREILGLHLGDSESEQSWMDFFRRLKGRGLSCVDLVVSDNRGGLAAAIRILFQGVTWQRCQTHLSANISSAAPKAVQEELHGRARAIFEAPELDSARILLAKVVADFEVQAPTAVAILQRGFDDATAELALPRPYRKRLRTTNGQERLNEEIRRRERVIRIFPNRESALRLLGALLMAQDEHWSTGKRYFDMTAYLQWRSPPDKEKGDSGATTKRWDSAQAKIAYSTIRRS